MNSDGLVLVGPVIICKCLVFLISTVAGFFTNEDHRYIKNIVFLTKRILV